MWVQKILSDLNIKQRPGYHFGNTSHYWDELMPPARFRLAILMLSQPQNTAAEQTGSPWLPIQRARASHIERWSTTSFTRWFGHSYPRRNTVMTKVTGWCHPLSLLIETWHVKLNPTTTPTDAEFNEMCNKVFKRALIISFHIQWVWKYWKIIKSSKI